jgi:uncharacterized membrane protein YcaP (DUF421 family)
MNPYLDIVLRSVVVYLFIVLAIRLFGKKELAQLSVVDLVFILLISNAVQNAMVGPDSSLLGGIIAAGSLFVVNFILKHYLYRNKKFNRFLQGHPVMLIHNGIALTENCKRQDITIDELESAIREHGVEKIEDVNLAVLEMDGNISILSENYNRKTVRKRKAHKVLSKNT